MLPLWSDVSLARPNTSESYLDLVQLLCEDAPSRSRWVKPMSNMWTLLPLCAFRVLHEDECANGNQLHLRAPSQDTLAAAAPSACCVSTGSAGGLTSNTPLMADKVVGPGPAGQQMGTFGLKTARRASMCFSGSPLEIPGQLFSWDVKRKQVSGLWESNKTSKPGLVKDRKN